MILQIYAVWQFTGHILRWLCWDFIEIKTINNNYFQAEQQILYSKSFVPCLAVINITMSSKIWTFLLI